MRSLCPFAERFLPTPPGPHHTPARAIHGVRPPVDASHPPGPALGTLHFARTDQRGSRELAQPAFRTPLPGTTCRGTEHSVGPRTRPQPVATSPTGPLPGPPGALGHHASVEPKATHNRGSETRTWMDDAATLKSSNQEAVVDLQTRPLPATANRWPPPSLANTMPGDSSSTWTDPYSRKCTATVEAEWMKYPCSTSGNETSPITQ